jgi:hypothetical protein
VITIIQSRPSTPGPESNPIKSLVRTKGYTSLCDDDLMVDQSIEVRYLYETYTRYRFSRTVHLNTRSTSILPGLTFIWSASLLHTHSPTLTSTSPTARLVHSTQSHSDFTSSLSPASPLPSSNLHAFGPRIPYPNGQGALPRGPMMGD